MTNSALEWQKQIYLDGFSGRTPIVSPHFAELEKQAERRLSKKAFAYIAGGAGLEETIRENTSAFARCKIIPRVLKDVGQRDTSVRLFNMTLPSPYLLAPIGVLELAHKDADLAVARAASAHVPMIFSNQASFCMEDCASVMGNSPRWFQLYWSKSNDLVASFVRRAESCGCSAIVVTLDTTMLGWRVRDLSLGYLPFLEGKGIAQYTSDPIFQKMMDEPDSGPEIKRRISIDSVRGLISMVNRYPEDGFFRKLRSQRPIKAVRKFIETYSNPCTTWKDLNYLRGLTSLPIILKGILHADDAQKAIDAGVDGIVISNHGGRQVDGSISSLQALLSIAGAVQGRIPILLDSGIRSGSDAFKAIALGATAVCVGRPYAYGLAVAGKEGIYQVMRNFMSEFELTMGLAGCSSVSEINGDMVTFGPA